MKFSQPPPTHPKSFFSARTLALWAGLLLLLLVFTACQSQLVTETPLPTLDTPSQTPSPSQTLGICAVPDCWPTYTTTPTPLRATILAMTVTEMFRLTATRPTRTPTPLYTITRTPTNTATWFLKVFPSITPKKWPTYTRTPTPKRTATPNQTSTLAWQQTYAAYTATSQYRKTVTASAITQTAVANNQVVSGDMTSDLPQMPGQTLFSATALLSPLDKVVPFSDSQSLVLAARTNETRRLLWISLASSPLVPVGLPVEMPPEAADPSASPVAGSQWLAFSALQDGKRHLFAADLSAARLVQLTSGDAEQSQPDWSPDGSRLVFVQDALLYSLDVSWLTGTAPDPLPAQVPIALPEGVRAADPSWSPLGRWIAFTRIEADGTRLAAVRPQDGLLLMLTSGAFQDSQPDWLADGSGLVFTSNRDGNADIFNLNCDWINTDLPTTPDPLAGPSNLTNTTNRAETSPQLFPGEAGRVLFVRRVYP